MVQITKRGHSAVNAAAEIRRNILEGRILPGSPLREEKLAQELEVSRNTLREAFRSLVHEGLVVHEANFGARVKQPSEKEIRDLYQLRRWLEVPVLRDAVATRGTMEPMEAAILKAQKGRESGDWSLVGTADLEFHRAIIALAQNERLIAIYDSVAIELRLVFQSAEDLESLHEKFVDRNAEILELLKCGESNRAADLLSDYLELSERIVLATYVPSDMAEKLVKLIVEQ